MKDFFIVCDYYYYYYYSSLSPFNQNVKETIVKEIKKTKPDCLEEQIKSETHNLQQHIFIHIV